MPTTGNPLNIAVVGNGRSVHVVRRASGLARLGHHVSLVTPTPPLTDVRELPVRYPSKPLRCGAGDLPALSRWFRTTLAEVEPDLVYVHYVGGPKAWLAFLHGRAPLLLSAMGDDVLDNPKAPKQRWEWAVSRLMMRDATLVTAKTEMIGKRAVAMGADAARVHTIVWGVDTRFCRPTPKDEARQAMGLPRGKPLVLSPRSLMPQYNIDMLIEALPAVVASVPDVVLVLTEANCDSVYRERLQRRARELNLDDHVHWSGSVKPDRMSLLYGAADVSVSLSPSDGMPQSLLESMACGCPSVIADLPVYREMVEHGSSAWMTPLSPLMIADALVRLLTDGAVRKRIANGGREVVVERADWERQLQRVEGLLQWAVAHPKPRRISRKVLLLACLAWGGAALATGRSAQPHTRSGC